MRKDAMLGRRFGSWYVMRRVQSTSENIYYQCKCDCGSTSAIRGTLLRHGRTKSCGCLRDDSLRQRVGVQNFNFQHGATAVKGWTAEYRSYVAAKARCLNPNVKSYSEYGGRGIRFLFNSFEEWFEELGAKPEPKRLYSVDRYPDNDGHYQKGNVRWATMIQQRNNRRDTAAAQVILARVEPSNAQGANIAATMGV